MATSITPILIDALFAAATEALPDVDVLDGLGVTNDVGDTLMIGVDDPESTSPANSAEASQVSSASGTTRPRAQTGTLTCAATSGNGDSDAKAARDGVYAIQAAVENLLRADPQLGIPRSSGQVLVIQLADERLTQNVYDEGCEALLVFTIAFEARL